MIKKFQNNTIYESATKPTSESQVAMLEDSKAVKYDGVNVIAEVPEVGDAVFLDENNKPVILKGGDWLVKSNVPVSWTYVGEVLEVVDNNHVRVLYKDTNQTKKYADVLQYALTAIASTDLTLKLRIRDTSKSGDAQYATSINVPVTLTSTAFDATTVAEITAALEAKATELGDTRAWWCYLSNDNNEKVDENATRIIIQCDQWNNYQEYNCSCTGGTLSFVTWGDMPANSTNGFRVNGIPSNPKIMNVARCAAYYSTNGRTPAADVQLNEAETIVTSDAFTNSPYCALLRQEYGTYENYIASEYLVKLPQKLGVFSLPDGKTMCTNYGNKTAPTKSGDSKYKFPALNWPMSIALNADGMRQGQWHLMDVREGCLMMRDETLTLINKTRQKMSVTQISNSAYRWLAARSYINTAWNFSGTSGTLSNSYVHDTVQVGAVTLLKFK